MRSLGLALRGLWWRRWSSLALLLVAMTCTAIAAAGPAFAAGARDAVLQATLRAAPTDPGGTGFTVQLPVDQTVSLGDFAYGARTAFARLVKAGFAREPVYSLQAEKPILGGPDIVATLPVVYRSAVCAHVRMISGTCLAEGDPLGVLVTAETARSRHVRVGSSIVLKKTVHVRGIYEPLDPYGTYWFDSTHDYFGQVAAFATSTIQRGDATLVPETFWTRELPPIVGDDAHANVDVSFDPARIHVPVLDTFRRLLNAAVVAVQEPTGDDQRQGEFTTGLVDLLAAYNRAARAVGFPILVVAVQLVVLSWLVLYLVLVSSAESRTGEVVLGKLRGLRPRETLAHALLEPLLLVAAAVPIGVLVADGVLRATARPLFGPHAEVSLPAAAWWAAAAAGLGGVLALGAAGVSALRRSVVDQWRRAERRPRRSSWVLDAIVVTLAAAGFVDLLAAPSAENAADTNAQFIAAGAPTLLAVAVALLAARMLPMLARASFGRTRGSPRVGLFVTVRQIGRRRGDLRVFLLLAVSVALLVFGIASRSVFADNQRERALFDVGTERVVSVRPDPQLDLAAVVAKLDPGGRSAAAVYDGALDVIVPEGIDPGDGPTSTAQLLVVDPERFGSVAYWRSDFGPGGASLAARLGAQRATPPEPVRVTGTRLTVTLTATIGSHLPVEAQVGLTDNTGAAVSVRLGLLSPSSTPISRTLTASIPRCASGCLLRRISLRQNAQADLATLRATLVVRRVVASGSGASKDVLPALLQTSWSTTDALSANSQTGGEIQTADGVLRATFAPTYPADSAEHGYGLLSAVPTSVPALVTKPLVNPRLQTVTATLDTDDVVSLSPTEIGLLPRAGNAGVVVSRSWLPVLRSDSYSQYAPNEVWLSPGAPADFPARLATAGVDVVGTQSAAGRERDLGDQGPSFAVAMLLFGGLAAGALAIAGAATSLLIASRRRLYEIAAVRSLGLPPRRVLTSLVVEQGAIAVVAAIIGLLAGVVGARVALDKLPEFSDQPPYPALLIDLPLLLCVALAIAVVIAVLLVAAAGGASLVRRASPSRLREAQT